MERRGRGVGGGEGAFQAFARTLDLRARTGRIIFALRSIGILGGWTDEFPLGRRYRSSNFLITRSEHDACMANTVHDRSGTAR